MKVMLDKYEQQIEDALSKGEYIGTSDLSHTKELFRQAARNSRATRNKKYYFTS
jgi:hypothetical protein